MGILHALLLERWGFSNRTEAEQAGKVEPMNVEEMVQAVEKIVAEGDAVKRWEEAEGHGALVMPSEAPVQEMTTPFDSLFDQAIAERRWVFIAYRDFRGKPTQRKVLPYSKTESFILALCDMRYQENKRRYLDGRAFEESLRTFRRDRISEATLMGTVPAPVHEGLTTVVPANDKAALAKDDRGRKIGFPRLVSDPTEDVGSGDWRVYA